MTEVLNWMMLALTISMAFCLIRMMKGPSIPDRVIALDTAGVHLVALVAVYSIKVGQLLFLDAALVAALLFFLGTAIFSRYLEQREEI